MRKTPTPPQPPQSFLATIKTKLRQYFQDVLVVNPRDFVRNQILINLLLAIIASYGVVSYIDTISESLGANYIIGLILFGLFVFALQHTPQISRREKIFAIILAVITSFCLTIGSQLEYHTTIFWSFGTIIKLSCLAVGIYVLLRLAISWLARCKLRNIKDFNSKKLVWLTFLAITFCGFLVWLALYPGVYGYDAGFQIDRILNPDSVITSHYSLLFSALLAGFVQFGQTCFNSYEFGLALFTLLQMLFLAFVATRITIYVVTKTKNLYLYLFSLLFFCFFPTYTILAVSSAQDVIFAGLFALVFLNLLKLVEDSNYWQRVRNPISLAILALLLCMFRNNGIYCLILVVPFALVLTKSKKWWLALALLAPIVIYKIYTGPIFDFIGVQKTDTMNEMLSVPSQQLARVYNTKPTAFTETDLQTLRRFYPHYERTFPTYAIFPEIADAIKNDLNNQETSDNFGEYLGLWARVGLRSPSNYVDAFLLNTLSLWYPEKQYPDSRVYHPYIEFNMVDMEPWGEQYLNFERHSKFPAYGWVLEKIIAHNSWQKLPLISVFFSAGTYFIIFCLLVGLVILRRAWKYFLPLSLILGLYATLFLTPASLVRYVFPIMILAPVLLTLVITIVRTTKSASHANN